MDQWYSISGFSDPISSLSHLVGTAIFFVFAIFLLAAARQSRLKFWLAFEFAFATLLMLTMSFVYHMMSVGSISREVMLRLDVAAIFVMIASTFTVLHGILFSGWRRWAIISLLWTITIVGVTLRTIFFHSIPGFVGDGIFLLMGWIGAFSAYLIWKEFKWRGVLPIIIGGLFYTVGAIINAIEWPILIPKVWGPHETFHFMVLGGVGTHWALVWSICDGSFQRRVEEDRTKEMRGQVANGSLDGLDKRQIDLRIKLPAKGVEE